MCGSMSMLVIVENSALMLISPENATRVHRVPTRLECGIAGGPVWRSYADGTIRIEPFSSSFCPLLLLSRKGHNIDQVNANIRA
jgi:hypothetical protein